MQLVLVSGLSGSGKSIALNVLEDSGYYCVDNLPVKLLQETVQLLRDAGNARVAMSIDARSGGSLDLIPGYLDELKAQGVDVRLLFLDAKDGTLIRRFAETRRRHPLAQGNVTLDECLARERELLSPIAEVGHRIDTSDLYPNALRNWIRELMEVDSRSAVILFESFAYKQGVPLDADLVFDARCLPNPFYDPRLRPSPGSIPTLPPSSSASRRSASFSPTYATSSRPGCPHTRATTAATSPWRSAVPAASTAPCISWKGWPRISAPVAPWSSGTAA